MKIGLLGIGTVGQGVFDMAEKTPELDIAYVLVRPGKERAPLMVSDVSVILNDPEVEAVAEVMGGIEPAFTYAMAVLRSGKHFVTANKALVAAHGIELAAEARVRGVGFLFSAACGGGVPFLHNLSLAGQSDEILSVGGILNGTTNYMLDAMQRRGMTYAEALKDAQALGYAEADPTADVSGLDALRKIVLASAVGFGKLPTEGFCLEGIEHFSAEDALDLRSRGLTCRLVGEALPQGDTVSALVEPVLFPASAPEVSVLENYNLARYEGKCSGPMVFMGQGAGRYPTASAVLRDLTSLLRGGRSMLPESCVPVRADSRDRLRRYYVRVSDDCGMVLPFRQLHRFDGKCVRGMTSMIPVTEMHEYARKIRMGGREIFFAAMGE